MYGSSVFPRSSVVLCFSWLLISCNQFLATSVDFTWSGADEYENEIYVSQDGGGKDNSSCWRGINDCATVNMALRGIINNSTVVYVGPGTYDLNYGNETTIESKQDIAIIGSGMNETTIHCSVVAGLTFSSSSNIVITNITFIGCGQMIIISDFQLYFQAALFSKFCHDVFLTSVHVHLSNGTGVMFYRHTGEMLVDKCLITDSKAHEAVFKSKYFSFIGGGVLMLFSVKLPLANYVINGSIISGNMFTQSNVYKLVSKCLYNFGLAGISHILIQGNVTIESTNITNNTYGLFTKQGFLSHTLILNSYFDSNNESNVIQNTADSTYEGNSIMLTNVTMSDTLVLRLTSEKEFEMEWRNGYLMTLSEKNLSISISENEGQNLKCKLKLTKNCTLNAFAGVCSDGGEDYSGHCSPSYSTCRGYICSCDNNHAGRLCGACDNGYSVPVNSPLLSCVNCTDIISIVKGWSALIGIEFIPVTVMIALIAVLGINLNQGSLNAFIFFCQILTLSFPSLGYPSWFGLSEVPVNPISTHHLHVALLPLSIWNLDFISALGGTEECNTLECNSLLYIPSYFYGIPICISHSTTPMGAIFFWYVIAFYPIVLLLLMFICIILYNRGCRAVVCVLRPLHYRLARFWRKYDVRPSLISTTGSVFTLCFTQLAAVSFKLLQPSYYDDETSKKTIPVFFYDGTIDYFHSLHILSVIAALTTLIFLMIVILFLALHPFLWFQKCLNKVRFRKDFIVSLTEVFTAPFKHSMGNKSSFDYRYFSGSLFCARLIIMCFYFVPQYSTTRHVVSILEATFCCLYISTIFIFRPYNRFIHVFTEMIIFSILGVFSLVQFYGFSQNPVFWFWRLVFPIYLFVYAVVILYCVAWIIRKLKYGRQYSKQFQRFSPQQNHASGDADVDIVRSIQQSSENTSSLNDRSLPDRLNNPDEYNAISSSNDRLNTTYRVLTRSSGI